MCKYKRVRPNLACVSVHSYIGNFHNAISNGGRHLSYLDMQQFSSLFLTAVLSPEESPLVHLLNTKACVEQCIPSTTAVTPCFIFRYHHCEESRNYC